MRPLFPNMSREESLGQGGIAFHGEVVINFGRIYEAVVSKYESVLVAVEGDLGFFGYPLFQYRIFVKETFNKFFFNKGLIHYLRDVLCLDLGIKGSLGMDDHDRAFFAKPVASRDLYFHLALEAVLRNFFVQSIFDLVCSIGAAA
jgi:hypothetical protein